LLGCGSPAAEKAAEERPNVLLILVDDLRPDLGVYGHPIVKSPGIDRLAATGMRFDRAYAQYPICNPSRASLLTGLRPDTTGILDNRTPFPSQLSDVVTLPQLFHDHGYFTVSVGKIFHGSGRKGNWKAPRVWDLASFPRAAKRAPMKPGDPTPRGHVGRYSWRMVLEGEQGLQDTRVASRAIEVLEQVQDKTFFVAIGLRATHPHFAAPARFFDLYPVSSIVPPPLPEDGSASLMATLHGRSDEDAAALTKEQKQDLIRAYWACVSFVDAQVGKILDALDRLDLSHNTVVVLVSDHGYHLGEQGWWSKLTLYEAATRVPLIIRTPRMEQAGKSSRRLVELVDLYPTLAELAGFEPRSGIEGRSLVPLLHDPERPWQEAVFSQINLGRIEGRSVRTEDLRYTEWNRGQLAVELFDYASDPTGRINRAQEAGYAAHRRRLRALLQ